MAGHTIVNLKEIEDMAPQFGFAPDLEARFATGALGLEKSGLSYQRLAPDFRMPFGHRHKEQEEVYVIVSGGGRVKLDDEIVGGAAVGRGARSGRDHARFRGRPRRSGAAGVRRSLRRRVPRGRR